MVLQHSRRVSALTIDCHMAAFSGSGRRPDVHSDRLGDLHQQQQRALPVLQLLPYERQLSVGQAVQYDSPVSTQPAVAPPIALFRSRSERLRSVSLFRWSLLVNCFFMSRLLESFDA